MFGAYWQRRRQRKAEHEAAMRTLRDEYIEKLDSEDADTFETSRDYSDNDSVPWRLEVGLNLGLVVLFVSVLVLVAFFSWIKHLTSG
jgi:hypothetical protein